MRLSDFGQGHKKIDNQKVSLKDKSKQNFRYTPNQTETGTTSKYESKLELIVCRTKAKHDLPVFRPAELLLPASRRPCVAAAASALARELPIVGNALNFK